uniref:Uncharacterized protein n=1 Tax=Molossus molossus TaxID=27622 RepID=A0A7J8GLN5_MOLMO|nr:hypothetical protein HJG59_011505 [Molossus molossus]
MNVDDQTRAVQRRGAEGSCAVVWGQPATMISGSPGRFSLHCGEVPLFWKIPGLPWEEAVGVARAKQPEPHSAPGTIGPVDTLCQHRPVHSGRAAKVPVAEAANSWEPSTIPHNSSPIKVDTYPSNRGWEAESILRQQKHRPADETHPQNLQQRLSRS